MHDIKDTLVPEAVPSNLIVSKQDGTDSSAEERGIPGSKRSALFYIDRKPLPIVDRGEGIYLWDTEGKKYLDGCSGAMAVAIGHGNKRVAKAAEEQAKKVAFAYRTQFESQPANDLANLLTRLGPEELNRIFFVNSGSESVEAAIKLARQYWWSENRGSKYLVISRRPSYHGATLGALSSTDYAPLNTPFLPLTLPFPKISAPYCYHCPLDKKYPDCQMACAKELERCIRVHGPENIAAFITEPIGGASTGGAVPPDEWFPMVADICKKYDILLIVDEVLTGCGRTGTFLGFEHWQVVPDIVAISKGLGGGYTPIGACMAKNHLVEAVMDSGGFMHGHTYAGNPLSSAIALEVLNVMLDEELVKNSRIMGTYLHEKLHSLKDRFGFIGDVRGRGLLAGVEFVRDRLTREPFPPNWMVAREATEIARELGLLIYPRRSLYGLSGDHVVLAPPLIITQEQIDEMIALFEKMLVELEKLLDSHYARENANITDDETEARYEVPEDLPAYTEGDLSEVAEPGEGVNVTSLMSQGEQDPKPADLVEESEIL